MTYQTLTTGLDSLSSLVGLGGDVSDWLEVDVSSNTKSGETTENDVDLVTSAAGLRCLVGVLSRLSSESRLLG